MSNQYSIIRYLRSAAAALLLAAAAACGPFHKGGGTPPATLVFHNEALDQATVYAVAPGSDFVRVGTVMPGRTEELSVPGDIALRSGTLNIVVRLLAHSGLAETGPVAIQPGERYDVTLPLDGRLVSFLPARQP